MQATEIRVDRVRFNRASEEFQNDGLLGWVSFVLNGTMALDGVMVRRTREGRITVSFPARRDRSGYDHPYIRPLGSTARRETETQLLAALPDAITRSREAQQ
ncbi:MAG: hypothetical protein V3W41_18305 [Planctomycetota bacterium]